MEDTILVDFQLINYGHPAYDVLYLLYLSSDQGTFTFHHCIYGILPFRYGSGPDRIQDLRKNRSAQGGTRKVLPCPTNLDAPETTVLK